MDIHIWISIYGYPQVYVDIQNEHKDIPSFRYLYKSMDIHTRITIPDAVRLGRRRSDSPQALGRFEPAATPARALHTGQGLGCCPCLGPRAAGARAGAMAGPGAAALLHVT